MARIQIIGSSGAGKTTLGRSLAERLRAPFIDLDDLFWEPGWRQVGHEELARRVAPIVDGERWVIAGNYFATSKTLVWPRTTHVVVLDLPYLLLLRRCLWRTLVRGVTGVPCCNGNRESVWRLFHRDGLVRYLTRSFGRHRARYAALPSDPALRNAAVVHLQSRRAVDAWFDRRGLDEPLRR